MSVVSRSHCTRLCQLYLLVAPHPQNTLDLQPVSQAEFPDRIVLCNTLEVDITHCNEAAMFMGTYILKLRHNKLILVKDGLPNILLHCY